VHGHCHDKSLMGMRDEEALLRQMGLAFTVLDSGCCGMAGAFGFERDHYDISLQIGERVLLPAVRAAEADTLIVTDGFSCREQITQATGRRALHLAELLRKALPQEQETPAEEGMSALRRTRARWRTAVALGLGALSLGALLAGGLLWRRSRSEKSPTAT